MCLIVSDLFLSILHVRVIHTALYSYTSAFLQQYFQTRSHVSTCTLFLPKCEKENMCYYFQTVCDNQHQNKKKIFKVFKHNIFSVFHFLSFYNFHCIYSNKALLVLLTIPYYPTLNSVTQSCPTLRPHGLQASLSITNSRSLLQLMFIKSVMPSNHLILCRPLLLLPSIFPSIRVLLAHD